MRTHLSHDISGHRVWWQPTQEVALANSKAIASAQSCSNVSTATFSPKLNGLDPEANLRVVLECWSASPSIRSTINRVDELLPWAIAPIWATREAA